MASRTLDRAVSEPGREAVPAIFFDLGMEKNEKKIKDRIGIVLDDGCFYDELSLAEMKNIISSVYTEWSEQDFKRYMDMLFWAFTPYAERCGKATASGILL